MIPMAKLAPPKVPLFQGAQKILKIKKTKKDS
jgi:hypothetical protein